jgi:type II restriction enzyme
MEREGAIPERVRGLDDELTKMCSFLGPLLDPGLFPWIGDARAPSAEERDKALLVVGERLAGAFYLPTLRNTQEARQKEALRAFLERRGFEESLATAFELPAGTFGFGRNVPVVRPDGERQNLPVDCVVAPFDDSLPLACIELKSAGDFANVNKRRKEESDKHEALRRAHGDDVVFLLQLFGYFGPPYLGFEASAGIDWAWDHRLEDFEPYLGP